MLCNDLENEADDFCNNYICDHFGIKNLNGFLKANIYKQGNIQNYLVSNVTSSDTENRLRIICVSPNYKIVSNECTREVLINIYYV
jgi:hypothetical protein